MYIGAEKSCKNVFTIESYHAAIRSNIVETTLERDLGVMISADLKWRNHVIYCANKANKVLGMLLRTFEYRFPDLIKSLYTTFVRPHLEFAVSVWSPHMHVKLNFYSFTHDELYGIFLVRLPLLTLSIFTPLFIIFLESRIKHISLKNHNVNQSR
jgi:hypothetical protein